MINVFHEDGAWQVWHDVEGLPADGVCIGCGTSKQLALFDAKKALEKSIREVEDQMEPIIGALAEALANDPPVLVPDPGFAPLY